jgi:hypothetical protein
MARPPIRLLKVGETVELSGEFANGYYKVRTSHGEDGWAWARNVSVTPARVTDTASKRLQLLASTNLRRDPSTQQPAIRLVQPNELLRLVEPAPRAGYYHIITPDGQDGWVWGRAAVIVDASRPAQVAAPAAPAAPPAPVAKEAPAPPPAPVVQAPVVQKEVPAPRPAPAKEEIPPAPAPVVKQEAVPPAPPPAAKEDIAPPPAPVAKVEPPAAPAAPPAPEPKVPEPVAEAPKLIAPAEPEPVKQAPRAPSGGLQAGDMLDRSNAHLAKGMLPDELLRHYEQGEYANRIVDYPLGNPAWEASFVEATRRNAETLRVDEKGTIIDRTTGQQPAYIYGLPFPNIDPSDPQAGVKAIWNQYLAIWYGGSAHTKTKVLMFNTKGLERELGAEGFFKFYDGEPEKYRKDNPLDLQAQFLAFALSPSDMQGTAALSWRYRDPNKRDSQWAYVPALRRVRAISPANRSDGYLGSDISSDDGYFFDGKPEDFDWRLVEKRDAFRIVDPDNVTQKLKPRAVAGGGWEALTATKDDYYGYQADGWKGLPWAIPAAALARRPMWLVEAVPRDKYYLYGRLVLWIDAETWDGSYHQKFTWTGEHVLTYSVMARVNQPTGPRPEDETVQTATLAWAVAENFKMRRASLAGARFDAKSPFDRRVPIDTSVFDAGQLVRFGK